MNSGLNVMLDLNRLHGIFPPILTPMNDDESPDLESLASLTDFLIGNGVHGIWVNGTTGEFPCFDASERAAIVRRTVETVAGRVPVIAGIGDCSTRLGDSSRPASGRGRRGRHRPHSALLLRHEPVRALGPLPPAASGGRRTFDGLQHSPDR